MEPRRRRGLAAQVLRALPQIGITLPEKFKGHTLIVDLVGARLRLGTRDVAQILDMPTMSDERLTGAVRLIAALAKAAYQVRPELCVAVNARMVNICLKHGNTPDAAIGYMVVGCIFLGGVLGRYQQGYEFGRLALELVEKYDNAKQRAEVNFVVGYFGTSWLRPATDAETLWKAAYTSGLDSDDLSHTGCACCATILSYFMRGVPTNTIMDRSAEYLDLLQRVGLREPAGAVTAVRQAIRNLRGETKGATSFEGDDFDEEAYVAGLESYGSRHFAHYYFITKMQTLYLWGEHDAALEVAEYSAGYLKDSQGMLHAAEHHFYEALILAALYSRGAATRRRAWWRKIRKAHQRLKTWATLCPPNFRHKERIVAAELARIGGEAEVRRQCLDDAVAAAKADGYLHLEALAHRLAAAQCQEDNSAVGSRLGLARDCYRRWGALGIAESIQQPTIEKS